MKTLKKITYNLLATIALSIVMSACNDILDAPSISSMEEDIIFSDVKYAEQIIPSIIQSFGEQNSYRARYLVYYGINTDCEVYCEMKKTTDAKSRYSNYNTVNNNTEMNTDNNAWAKFYEGIERANIAIRGLRTYGKVESNPQMAQILGEVITLRAVLYWDLVKAWGDVPARFEPITNETAYVPKSDRDVIYKQLLADLDEAAGLVAWPNETATTTSTEHINKAFVKGLRARIALTAGGYSQRTDGLRLSTDPELSRQKMYAIAKQECLDIIESHTCKLNPSFENVFKEEFCKEKYQAGGEILWEIPFASGRGRVIFDLGVKHTTTDKYTGQAKGGTNGINPAMYYEYDPTDVRRDVTCIPYEWQEGVQFPSAYDNTKYKTGKDDEWKWNFRLYIGKYRYEWLPRMVTLTNDDGLNWLYMRYADVLLMAAEAINELEGPGAAASYLQEVVERAYPNNPDKASAYLATATANKETFFHAIVDQRALEFAGEMLRKADLIRWNLLGAKLHESQDKLVALHDRTGDYANLPTTIYWNIKADKESIEIYGINHGETDEIGATLGYEYNAKWKIADDYSNGLSVRL
ncbi:starch-binding protein [Bacteroidia bacterium]|nr:starch-binding protein [Bacteroidia bacterium]